MIPTPGYAYFIQDDFFRLFGSPSASKLCCNKGAAHMRPYYCCKQDPETGLYWMIPMSTQCKKYFEQTLKQQRLYGNCITITMAKFAGKHAALLIQNAVPVHPQFLKGPFTKNGNPVPLHSSVQRIVYGNLQRSLAIHQKGGHIFFPNVDHIRDLQMELSTHKFHIPLDLKISNATAQTSKILQSAKTKDHMFSM